METNEKAVKTANATTDDSQRSIDYGMIDEVLERNKNKERNMDDVRFVDEKRER